MNKVMIVKGARIYQDHRGHDWPMDGCKVKQVFEAEYGEDLSGAWLRAKGFGIMKGSSKDYGNGRIHAETIDLIPINKQDKSKKLAKESK